MSTEKFEIKINKKEIKNAIEDINQSDFYKRIATQVKKVRSGKIKEAFKGNAEKWRKFFHNTDLDKYDFIVLSILREQYQNYQEYIKPIKKLIDFHDLKLKLRKKNEKRGG
ncbi:MAG: hypothetical protein HWN67_03935 [Candidatus Helarchaeota archaeon]|nr:hypothetical protein [Candidatus Helarchaeota archaeon]